jgi:hypothetical protein
MASWLRCAVGPGQFSSEYAVGGQQFNGTWFSLFVPRECVVAERPPTRPGESVEGWLRVEELERKGDLVLLLLPRQTLENGQYITVPADRVRSQAVPGAPATNEPE